MLRLPAALIERLLEEARRAYPQECCGLLLGDGPCLHPVRNLHPHPERAYEADPGEVLRALRAGTLRGFYHSHPDGSAWPSQRDHAEAWPGLTYLIVGRQVRAFRLRNGRLQVEPHREVA
ncbi:MAG: M67 family metallopeptidase [Candidatus Eremiobacterota bacterium]